ncbi:hemerythrin domain-containing protein [Chitinophaga alhagiae]|uniref:hemerythrin domain-containing protein n=1 Tax=Chitinophaga alhagiae TaxID=2203219 RepID=UPI000E5B82DE|nr:hemerythrin domain-containing protein [Chitinophaga alhagiae]
MTQPIKRSEHIAPLSRDHHHGLLFSWKIKQGLKKQVDTARITAYVDYFWNTHLLQHFREEETLLFNQVEDEGCAKALQQHKAIAELVKERDAASLAALAAQVDQHIRFEERELFPRLEAILPAEALARTGAELARLHETENKDDYKDEFWR